MEYLNHNSIAERIERIDMATVAQKNESVSQIKKLSFLKKNPEYFFWLALLFAFFSFLQNGNAATAAPVSETASAVSPLIPNPYEKTVISAKSVFVYDMKSRKAFFEKDADAPRPLASLTKLMTAATALSLIPETTFITISDDALNEEGDTGLRSREEWLLRDLLKVMLIESSNDAAYAVSSSVGAIAKEINDKKTGRDFFIKQMNTQARALKLSRTSFLNETGLDVNDKIAGAVGSAKEAALLLAAVLAKSPLIFSATKWGELTFENSKGNSHTAKNTNKDTDKFPLLLASKTGYTDLAGGNLLIAFDAGFNHPIIISVLGSTLEGRFTDAEKLLWATLEYLTEN